jgi:hypothetical protein
MQTCKRTCTTSIARNRLHVAAAGVPAVLAWFGLALQLYLVIMKAQANGTPVATAIVNYFSYFTILTNLLVAVVLTASLCEQKSGAPKFFATPSVQSAAAVSIVLVCAVYSLQLRQLWNPGGWQKVADIVLHDVMPVLYVLYWLVFVPKDTLRLADLPRWLAYPGLYLIYTLIRGALTARYPYPFLDVAKIGYAGVAINAVILLAAFSGAGLLFLAIGRWTSRARS